MRKKGDKFFTGCASVLVLMGLIVTCAWYSRLPVAYADGITHKIVYFHVRGMYIVPGDPLFKKLLETKHDEPVYVKHGYLPTNLHE